MKDAPYRTHKGEAPTAEAHTRTDTCRHRRMLENQALPPPPRAPGSDSYPLGGMIQHLLPGGVELPLVILQQPLLGQGDGFLGGTEHLCGPLEVLRGFLSFQLSLCKEEPS